VPGYDGSPAGRRLEERKTACSSVPAVVVILPVRIASTHLDRCPHLLEQLAGHLVHTDDQPFQVIGSRR
jgi:hypothetical protein